MFLHCPVEATFGLIGEKCKSLILGHLVDTTLRYNEISKLVPTATPKMLPQKLRKLEADCLLDLGFSVPTRGALAGDIRAHFSA